MEVKTAKGVWATMIVHASMRLKAQEARAHRRLAGPDPAELLECLASCVSKGRAEVFTVGRVLTGDTGVTGAFGDAEERRSSWKMALGPLPPNDVLTRSREQTEM